MALLAYRVGHNAILVTITGNAILNSDHYRADKKRATKIGLAFMSKCGATNVEVSGNRCFDDQQNKTQTWQLFPFRLYAGWTRDSLLERRNTL